MKKQFLHLQQGTSPENIINGTIVYSDMHGSKRHHRVTPFVNRIEDLENAIEAFRGDTKTANKLALFELLGG